MPIGRPWTLRGAPLFWPSHKTMSIGLLDRCGAAIRIPMSHGAMAQRFDANTYPLGPGLRLLEASAGTGRAILFSGD